MQTRARSSIRPRASHRLWALVCLVILSCDSTTEPLEVAGLRLTPQSSTISVESTIQLKALLIGPAGGELEAPVAIWSSADSTVAEVDASGMVRGLALGVAIISASAEGFGDSAAVVVVPRVSAIELSVDSLTLAIGGSVRLSASLTDEDGEPLAQREPEFSSEDPKIAIVDGGGVVTAVSPGVATITARADDAVDITRVEVRIIDFTTITLGRSRSCGLTTEREAFCWGHGAGRGVGDIESGPYPREVVGDHKFVAIDAGFNGATCAIDEVGKAFCWGAGENGEFGTGKNENSSVPVPVSGNLRFKSIAVGTSFSCGVTIDSKAYCWGSNNGGKLGDGSGNDSLVPVLVAGGLSWTMVSAGFGFACGLTTDQRAYCWGRNSRGQLGKGEDSFSEPVPVAVIGGLRFKYVEAGVHAFACGISVEDLLHCWGHNDIGQLGRGWQSSEEWSPALVPGLPRVREVDGDIFHACAVGFDGSAYCWGGFASSGQLGDGRFDSSYVPARVSGNLHFVSIETGNSRSCGVTEDHTGYCWGWDLFDDVHGVPVLIPGQR